MIVDQERIDNFNLRMSEWLSNQGILFQMKYSGGGGVLYSLWNILFRFLILLAILAVIGVALLYLRVGKPQFNDQLEADLKGFLQAEDVSLSGVGRQDRGLAIYTLESEGGETSFYESLKVKSLKSGMGLLSGLYSRWEGGMIKIEAVEMTIKAGAADDELAEASFNAMLKQSEKFDFKGIQVNEATIQWGYTETTYGKIENASLKARQESDGSWELVFEGGYFSQNWLKKMPIKELLVEVSEEKVSITKAEFKFPDKGELEFNAIIEGGGHRPKLTGSGTAKNWPIGSCLEAKYLKCFDGSLSGKFQIEGSTNSQQGVEMDWDARLEAGDELVLWNRFPILKALAVFDQQRSYRKVVFDRGNVKFKTGGRKLSFEQLDLESTEVMKLNGNLVAGYPTREEASAKLGYKIDDLLLSGSEGGDGVIEDEIFTLQKAGKASAGESISTESLGGGDSSDTSVNEMSYKIEAMERELDTPRIQGSINLGLAEDALSRFSILEKTYPLDQKTGRRWLSIDLDSNFEELTSKKADALYKKASNNKKAKDFN